MHLRYGTSLLSTPLPFWTCIITLGKEKWWRRLLLLKIIWLYWPQKFFLITKQFFLTVGQNNFGNKIPNIKKWCIVRWLKWVYFFLGAKMQALLDPSNLESAVQLATKLDDSIEEISLKVRVCTWLEYKSAW